MISDCGAGRDLIEKHLDMTWKPWQSLSSLSLFVSSLSHTHTHPLWGYNSDIKKFTYLNCTTHWFLVFSQNCETITTIHLDTFIIPLTNAVLISNHIPFLLKLATSGKPLIYVLCLWIFLLWILQNNIIRGLFLSLAYFT